MIRGIIFDCFGVLYVSADKEYLAQFSHYNDRISSLNHAANYGLISRKTYIESLSDIIGRPRQEIEDAVLAEHTINQQLVDYIRHLKKSAYKIAILSNIGRGWMDDFFDKHTLHDLFDAVVLSGEEKIAKPDPVIFQRTAQRLNVPVENCVMVDDSPSNCAAAKAIGMEAVVYHTVEQLQAELMPLLKKENDA